MVLLKTNQEYQGKDDSGRALLKFSSSAFILSFNSIIFSSLSTAILLNLSNSLFFTSKPLFDSPSSLLDFSSSFVLSSTFCSRVALYSLNSSLDSVKDLIKELNVLEIKIIQPNNKATAVK